MRSPSSSAPSTALSQALIRSAICWYCGLLVLGEAGLLERFGEVVQAGLGVLGGDGGEPGCGDEPVGGGSFELGCGAGVRGAGVQGKLVPELPEPGLLALGYGPVRHRVAHALLPAFFEGLVDGVGVPVGAAGYLRQGEPEGGLVKGVGGRGLGGQVDHLIPAGLEGAAALRMFPGEDPGLLVAEGAGA